MKTVTRDPRHQCDGKKRFDSYSHALDNTFSADVVYRCPHCKAWHISGTATHHDRPAMRGTRQLYKGFDAEDLDA